MSKPRLILSSVAVIFAACLLVAASAAAQSVTMKIGHATTKGAYDNWADTFKEGLAKRIGDRIKVEVYPLSQLGAIPAMVQGVQLGTIEMVMTPPAFLSGVDPRFGVLSAPGIFEDLMHGFRTVHDPAFKKAYWSIGDSKGLKMVSMTCDAPTDYATSTPIRKLSDFKGRKLRVFGSKLEIETLRRLGGAGVPMPLSEVVPAIQQKTIDGNKAGITIFVPFKYQRIAKYVLKPGEGLICSGRFVSKVWFDKLPSDLQKAILDQALATDPLNQTWTLKFVERMYSIWTKNGGELAELSPEDQAELRKRLSTVGDDVLKDRPAVLETYRVMKEAANRTRGG
ncbi:MAG: TRAP transporter substrate-binding protein [Deltaproteobacteria bacterium]|nr:TRAP transporter substrate-binding protein [Deltaproteobacteria bacterium]